MHQYDVYYSDISNWQANRCLRVDAFTAADAITQVELLVKATGVRPGAAVRVVPVEPKK